MVWKDCIRRFRAGIFRLWDNNNNERETSSSGHEKVEILGIKMTNESGIPLVFDQTWTFPRPSEKEGLESEANNTGGPFRATKLWNDVISHLKEHVHLKKRRIKMRHYETCFTGTDAVDVVLQRLYAEKVNFSKDVSRDKAIKLCAMLMENHVFEPVIVGNGDLTFDDSTSRFFRFIDDSDDENDNEIGKENKAPPVVSTPTKSQRAEKPPVPDVLEHTDILNHSATKHGQSQLVQDLMDITGAWKRYSYECLSKITPAKLFTKQLSLPDTRSQELPAPLPSAVEEEVWREVVLAQLLQLIDLPILDNILSYNHDQASKLTTPDMAFSNLAFRRKECSFTMLQNRQEDKWFEAALDCLECIAVGSDMLDMSLSEESESCQKLRLFELLSEHYKGRKTPLWSSKLSELLLAIYGLYMQGRRDVVLTALKLAVILLPQPVREELRRLLTFMRLASEESAVKLSENTSNREYVEQCFSPGVLNNKVLTPHQAGQLVLFMMDRCHEVFLCPPDVESIVRVRLSHIFSGVEPDLPPSKAYTFPSFTYCSRVSSSELKRQTPVNTEHALVDLMNNVLDNTDLSLKEKKSRLKQFSKHHPILFKEHFVNYL